MNISYFLKYLWRRKWLVVIPAVLALILAWFFTRNMAQSYSSTAELSTGYMELNPLNTTGRSPNNTVLFNNVIQTLNSKHILDYLSYKLLLHDLQGTMPFRPNVGKDGDTKSILAKFHGGKEGMIAALTNKADSFTVLDLADGNDRIIRKLADRYGYSSDALLSDIGIMRIEGSDFINITATTENADLSAFIANGICRAFLNYYQGVQGVSSASSLDTLKSIMDTKKQLLDNKLKLLQGNNDLTLSNSVGLITSLQGQLTQQKNNLIAAQVALSNVEKQITDNSGAGGNVANNEDIIALRNNIDNLYARYVNGGLKDANLQNQIDKLRGELQQKLSAAGNTVGGVSMSDLLKEKMDLNVKINVAKQTMADLQNKINSLNGAVQSSASREGVISGIQNEIEAARQDYMDASKLYNDALNMNIFAGNNFKQTLVASPSLYPNPSEKMKIIAFAGVGVFFVLIFLLLFLEFIDPHIKTPSYLKENIALPLLANLQRISLHKDSVGHIFSANGTLPEIQRDFREQVKQLRYEIEHSGKHIFLITGYHAGAGRTTLTQAVASGLSLTNNKVLLIDANFQHNSLTQIFHAEGSLQSFQWSGEGGKLQDKILKSATATEDENIKVIGCESGEHTPDEILPQANMLATLKKDQAGFDYVLIDAAALSKGPDSKELLKYADAVILLFAADQTLTEEDRKWADFLKDHTTVLGAVLNKVNADNIDL